MSNSSTDRLIYASLPQSLREAMKIAAQRFEWTREDWQKQTTIIQEAIADGWYTAEEIAVAYKNTPPRSDYD